MSSTPHSSSCCMWRRRRASLLPQQHQEGTSVAWQVPSPAALLHASRGSVKRSASITSSIQLERKHVQHGLMSWSLPSSLSLMPLRRDSKTMPFLQRTHRVNVSITAKPASISTPDLRPCQQTYMGESNARRLLKRSQLSKKTRPQTQNADEPIFTKHEQMSLAAAAAPFKAPPTGYSVQCYATHAEDEAKRKEAEVTARERAVLFNSINSCRSDEGSRPLRLKPLLSKYAQDYADMLFAEEHSHSSSNADAKQQAEQNAAVVVVMAPSGARVARLVSPPRIGALACAEMWYGGKYKRHLYSMSSENVAAHPLDCPCHLRIVFETMVDEGWKAIGIGRGEDGRWVVELGQ